MQFAWWAYHLISLSNLVYQDNEAGKRVWMIVGEGSVFFVLLLVGVWQLQKSIRKEIELSRDQKNFLLATTHELKTPISSVKLYLETLQKRKLSEEQKADVLSRALSENDRLNDLIDQMLMASRIESGANTLVFVEDHLSRLTISVMDRYQAQFPDRPFQLDIAQEIIGKFDRQAFQSILTNLIDNAIKYSEPKTIIKVSLKHKDSDVFCVVMDQGKGINDVSKVKTLFYREQDEDTRTTKGSGLGLYIVNQLCQLHGGKLTIESKMDIGSNIIAQIKLQ